MIATVVMMLVDFNYLGPCNSHWVTHETQSLPNIGSSTSGFLEKDLWSVCAAVSFAIYIYRLCMHFLGDIECY